MSAVAAGDVGRFAGLRSAVSVLQFCDDAIASLDKPGQLDRPLDEHARVFQTIDEQLLVLILRKDERIRVWADAAAHVAEPEVGNFPAGDPQVCRADLASAREHGVRESDLVIELERPRLHRDGARGGRRLRVRVDDAKVHPQPLQPEGEDQAGRTGADDEHVRLYHRHSISICRSRPARNSRPPSRRSRPTAR